MQLFILKIQKKYTHCQFRLLEGIRGIKRKRMECDAVSNPTHTAAAGLELTMSAYLAPSCTDG